jgi:hypothetical protein
MSHVHSSSENCKMALAFANRRSKANRPLHQISKQLIIPLGIFQFGLPMPLDLRRSSKNCACDFIKERANHKKQLLPRLNHGMRKGPKCWQSHVKPAGEEADAAPPNIADS